MKKYDLARDELSVWHDYPYILNHWETRKICAGGAGLPNNGKLGRSLQLINTCFLRSGKTPGTPLSLRGFSEGFYRRDCRSKLEVMIRNTLYMRLRACFDSLFNKSPRRALKKLRRVKGFRKKSLSEIQSIQRILKKISFIIKVLTHLIKFHENNIIRKRVFESIILFIYFIIILYVIEKKLKRIKYKKLMFEI